MEPSEPNEDADRSTGGGNFAFLTASRARLTALAALVIAVVMLSAGLALMTLQHRLQTDNADEKLQAQSEEVQEAFSRGALPRVITDVDSEDFVAQVVFDNTTVVASTANMTGQRALKAPSGDVQRQSTTIAISDSKYRIVSRHIGNKVVIHTGMPIDYVDEADDALRTGLAFMIPAVTLLLAVLAWWLIGRRADFTSPLTT